MAAVDLLNEPLSPIGLLDLLGLAKADRRRFKLVRHRQARLDLHDFLRRPGWLEAYQSFQSKPVFDNLDFIVVFIGLDGSRARFIGVYQILGRRPGSEAEFPKGSPFGELANDDYYYYEMRKLPGFETFEHRAIIDWGKATLAWHQWPSNKEVIEIQPKGQLLRPFDDYLGFTLTYPELQYLFLHPVANMEWQARLSAVAGVYLILATTTGAQYVGSASGVNGLWGRWANYAADGHGGNKLLRELIESDPGSYPQAFSYSVLQILPRTLTYGEVLRWEVLYKSKLGSRATGLNGN